MAVSCPLCSFPPAYDRGSRPLLHLAGRRWKPRAKAVSSSVGPGRAPGWPRRASGLLCLRCRLSGGTLPLPLSVVPGCRGPWANSRAGRLIRQGRLRQTAISAQDRKIVGEGKGELVREDLGGSRKHNKQNKKK